MKFPLILLILLSFSCNNKIIVKNNNLKENIILVTTEKYCTIKMNDLSEDVNVLSSKNDELVFLFIH